MAKSGMTAPKTKMPLFFNRPLFILFLALFSITGCQTKRLVSQLLGENPEKRGLALTQLPTLSKEKIFRLLPPLVKTFEEMDNAKIRYAVDALTVIGSTAVPVLIPVLQNQDPYARMSAAQTLGFIGEPAKIAVPSIVKLLKDSHPLVRDEAAIALANIGPSAKMAIPDLQRALRDKNKDVRRSAATAIKEIQAPPQTPSDDIGIDGLGNPS